MPIRIKSKKANFRRCGVAHPGDWNEYPDDKFTKEQLAILKADPKLQVEVVKKKDDDPLAVMTVADIKELLDKKKIEYPKDAKKADLLELAKKASKE
jgi:hypothetical protein